MGEVQFDEENQLRRIDITSGRASGLPQYLITKGIAKNAHQAEMMLFGVFLACVVLTLGIIFLNRTDDGPSKKELDKYIQQMSAPRKK